MEIRNLTCIGCPMGCALKVEIDGDKITVSGNTCIRGKNYAENEVTNPVRIITSTVAVHGGMVDRLSVKTDQAVPKTMIFDCMEEIKKIEVDAPVHIGDIVYRDYKGLGINIIATKNIEKKA